MKRTYNIIYSTSIQRQFNVSLQNTQRKVYWWHFCNKNLHRVLSYRDPIIK